MLPRYSFASTFKNEFGDEPSSLRVTTPKMNFSMSGTSDQILARMTDEQITTGLKRAKEQAALAEAMLNNPDDPWDSDHMDGPFPGTRSGENLGQIIDAEFLRLYSLGIEMLEGEQNRRRQPV